MKRYKMVDRSAIAKKGCFLFALCASFTFAFGQQKKAAITGDTFSIASMPHTWTLIDTASHLEVTGAQSFCLTAGKGTDLHHPASGAFRRHNAPKVFFTPAADFEFSAKVSPSFETRYNGAALLLYTDTTQWAKMLFQYTGSNCLVGMSVVESSVTDDSYYAVTDTMAIYMRVKKSGAVCSFYLSSDGVTWSLTRQFVYSKPDKMKLGFYAQSPLGLECQVVFSDIHYKALPQ